MPPAAVVLSKTFCPLINMFPPVPHAAGGTIIQGIPTVLIGNMPAATLGSMVFCPGPMPHPSTIILGSFTVLIGGKPAARVGDQTSMANEILDGVVTVEIGS